MKGIKKITLIIMLIIALLLVPGVILAADTEEVTEVKNAGELIQAVKSSGTIKLIDNIDLDEKLLIDTGVNIKLDLNGKTLDLATNEEGYDNSYTMTVKGDLTITGNGTINVNSNYGIGTSTSGGNLTIENGTFNGQEAIYVIADYGGKIVIEDGIFYAKYYTANGLDGYSKNPIEIRGGTFNKVGITEYDENVIAGNVKVTKGTFNRVIRGENIAENADITIKLDNDMNLANLWRPVQSEETITIPNGSKVTIDLNGHEITGERKLFDVKGAELTITGEGTIKETKPYYAPIYVSGDTSSETVINIGENVTLEGWAGITVSRDAANSKGITMNVDGKINAVNDVDGAVGIGININGSCTNEENIKVNLSSTAKINSTGHGIYAAGYANWTIDGSYIKGEETGIEIRAGKLLIKNDKTEIIGNSSKFSCEPNNNGTTTVGAGIAVVQHTTGLNTIVDIQGGTIKGHYALYESNSQENDAETIEKVSVNVNGGNFETINGGTKAVYSENETQFIKAGTFSTDVSEYAIDGYYARKQNNGMYKIESKTPGQVTGLKVTEGYNDLKIEWTKVSDAEGYIVYQYNDSTKAWKELKTTTDNSYTLSNLSEGTSYKFKVVAYKTEKDKYTTEATITATTKTRTDISKATVTGISNKTYTGKEVTQSVTVKLNGITLENGTDYTVSYSNNTNTGKATVTITGKGDYKGAITTTFIITPTKVTGLDASEQKTNSIKLSWSKVAGNVTGYKVYSYNYSKEEWEYVGKTSSTSYIVDNLKAGTTYKYRVRAYKNVDGTQYFGEYTSSLKTATAPKTPSVNATAGDKKVTFKWNKVSGATGYKIYMSTSKNGEYTRIKTITNNSTFSYTKSGLKENTTYYFKVRAYREADGNQIYSSYTETISVKTKKIHVVKKGDTLYSIAKKNNTTVAKLVKINNLKSTSKLKLGLRLKLN